MHKFITLLLITLLSLSFITEAHAKRFGGGRSFGVTRSASSYSQAPRAASAMSNPMMTKAKNIFMGLALGGLLASLFMGNGFGTGLLTWAMVLGGIFLITMLIRSRFQPRVANANMANSQFSNFQQQPYTPFQQAAANTAVDHSQFLRQAKATFLRLQAAYDNKNLADIRQFTMPEVFAEIQMQLTERGNEANITEVISLNAEVDQDHQTEMSVRFSGMIKEDLNAAAEPFNEIWHFVQEGYNGSWKVAGIQQEIVGSKV